VLNTSPRKGEITVVIGAGTIGLATIAALKAAEPSCRIVAIAKYPFQGQLAQEIGAEFVVEALQENVIERVGELCGSRVYKLSGGGAILAGGVQTVYDTVTSASTLNQSLRMIRGRGTLVVLGLAGLPEGVDWSPIWAKEIAVKGSLCYGIEALHGKKARTFARAIDLLAKGKANLKPLYPRKFPLANYRQAFLAATSKKSTEIVKASFAL
jgi:threonine dehydrogenase-like Zn-dependent dehydrogenase